jgi:SAM-dependent methyltransferase
MGDARHWNEVYGTKPAETVSWYEDEPRNSLAMLDAAGIGPDAAVVDVGGGASRLVDALLDRGFTRVSVLDLSSAALDVARARLAGRAGQVEWVVQDVTCWEPASGSIDLWHDRAVLHFLVDEQDRQAYLRALGAGLKPGGFAILAPFALTGPEKCSGLPVCRYSPESLQFLLGSGFTLMKSLAATHITPGGSRQDFIYCLFRRNVAP